MVYVAQHKLKRTGPKHRRMYSPLPSTVKPRENEGRITPQLYTLVHTRSSVMEARLYTKLTSDLENVLSRHVEHWDSGGLRPPPLRHHHVDRRESDAVIEKVLQVSNSNDQINCQRRGVRGASLGLGSALRAALM